MPRASEPANTPLGLPVWSAPVASRPQRRNAPHAKRNQGLYLCPHARQTLSNLPPGATVNRTSSTHTNARRRLSTLRWSILVSAEPHLGQCVANKLKGSCP